MQNYTRNPNIYKNKGYFFYKLWSFKLKPILICKKIEYKSTLNFHKS